MRNPLLGEIIKMMIASSVNFIVYHKHSFIKTDRIQSTLHSHIIMDWNEFYCGIYEIYFNQGYIKV